MRITFIALLFLLNTAHAKKVIVTLNPLDCVTCTSGLFQLCREDAVKNIVVVVRGVYKEDSAELNDKLEFYRFAKLKVSYDDKLYNKLNNTTSGIDKNRLFVVSNDGSSVLHTQELNKLNLMALRKALADSVIGNAGQFKVVSVSAMSASVKLGIRLPAIDSFCYSAIGKKLSTFDVQFNTIICCDIFGKYTLFNVKTHKVSREMNIDSASIASLYKSFYRDKFNERYPVIMSMMHETPSFKPVINSVNALSEDTMIAVVQVKDYMLDENRDTVVTAMGLIVKYQVKTGKVTACYTAGDNVGKEFYLWYVFCKDGKLYAQGLCGDSFCMQQVSLNEKSRSYSMGTNYIMQRPEKYAALKVPSTEEDNVVFNDGLCAFVYNNALSDLVSDTTLPIEFDEPATAYNTYRIIDLKQDENNYYILYQHKADLKAMLLPKNADAETNKRNITIGRKDVIDEYNIKFYDKGNRIVYRPVDKTCLYVSNISY